MIKSFLFPKKITPQLYSSLLLCLRILFGLLVAFHGLEKLLNYETLASGAFPDPIGIGSAMSVSLAVFAELFCGLAFAAGFLFRLSTLPLIATMAIAFFGVHGGNIIEGEAALINLVVFILLYITGPGRYAADAYIVKKNQILNRSPSWPKTFKTPSAIGGAITVSPPLHRYQTKP